MNYEEYIHAELLILIPVLYFVGVGLKTSQFPDKWIPVTLGVISVLLSAVWVIANSEISDFKDAVYAVFVSVTQGILAAGTSVYVNQIYIQSGKEE